MPFDAVRCANCGGEIQLDDAKESGVCIYCGMKVIYKDAVIKLQVSGNLSIADADGLEKSLQRAATFHELGYLQKEEEILLEVVNQYPRDHRAWAILSQNIFATFQMRNAIASGKKSPTEISNDEYAALTKITANRNLIVYLNNALKLVPSNESNDLKELVHSFQNAFSAFSEVIGAKIRSIAERDKENRDRQSMFDQETRSEYEKERKAFAELQAHKAEFKRSRILAARRIILWLDIFYFIAAASFAAYALSQGLGSASQNKIASAVYFFAGVGIWGQFILIPMIIAVRNRLRDRIESLGSHRSYYEKYYELFRVNNNYDQFRLKRANGLNMNFNYENHDSLLDMYSKFLSIQSKLDSVL